MTGQQTELFDPSATCPTPCPVHACPAIRFPGQTRVITCQHDLDPEHKRRPKGCLNQYRPEHTEIPY